jgi:hypothetical protein
VTLEERGFAALAVSGNDGAAEPCGERGPEPEVMVEFVKYAECISLSQIAFCCVEGSPISGAVLDDYRCDLAVELVLVWSLTAQREYVTLKYGIQGVRPTVMTIVPLDAGIRLPSYR